MRHLILIVTCFAILSSCNSKKHLSLIEEEKLEFVMPELFSSINVNYKIDKSAINDTFNTVIDSYLSSDLQLSALGMDVLVEKNKEANIQFLERSVLTTLPLKISLSKNNILGNIRASGILELNFVTQLDVDASWQLFTETKLEQYEWIEEPKLSLGGLRLSIGSLANSIIDKSKAQFEKQIDDSVADQLEIRSKVLETMKYIEQPLLIDTLLNSWVNFEPTDVKMSSFLNSGIYASGNLTVHGKTKISENEPEYIKSSQLPKFEWDKDVEPESHLNLVFDISYQHINKYLNDNYKGKKFENNGKYVILEDIELKKSDKKLVVVSNVTGSVNGELLISSVPRFDNDKQAFFADDIDINIKTKNVIHKAGAWMFKSKIKNQLKEMMYFSIADNLEDIQKTIDKQVENYSIPEKLEITANLDKINVDKFVLDVDRVHAFIGIDLILETKILDMSAFK